MKKLGLLLGVVALLVPSLVLAGDIKIGLMCPLTGKWASEGQDMKNIVSLLVDETNARGGINGSKVDLVVEDDAGDPRTAALAAQKLASAGVKELIVIAQDITRYGIDLYHKRMLGELLTELCKLPFFWIRLHYLYPDDLDDALIDVIAREPKVLNYIDIPLQHINDGILKRMCRRSTKAEILALLAKLRDRLPGLVLRTSLICGLPGEGEAELEELCVFLRETKIERAGVFPFSPEEGTRAARMDHVDMEEARRRAELVVDVQSDIIDAYNESVLGTEREGLCEGFDSQAQMHFGRSYAESPDIDGRIWFDADREVEPGTFVTVRLTGVMDGELTGELAEE